MKFISKRYKNLLIYTGNIKFRDGEFETNDPNKIKVLLQRDDIERVKPEYDYKPLVSVIMACYNAEDYIKTAIDSVKAQTYEDWELVIVNDASTDNTLEVIEKETEGMDNVKVFSYKTNGNPGRSRKKACKLATGEVFAILDGDDALSPEALERVLSQYEPLTDIVYSTYYKCNKHLMPQCTATWPKAVKITDPCTKGGSMTHFFTIKRKCYELSGGYSTKYKRATDKFLFYNALRYGRAKFINEPLYYYRSIYTDAQRDKGQDNDIEFKRKAAERERGISIIIPCKGREGYLNQCKSSIKGDIPYEIIVVSKGEFSRASYLNKGAKKAKYNNLFFVDCDIVFPDGFLEVLSQKIKYNSPYFPIVRNERGKYFDYHAQDGWRVFGYGMLGIKSRDFWAVGGWDEEFTTWGREDNAIHYKLSKAGMDIQRERSGLTHLNHKPVEIDSETEKRINDKLDRVKKGFLCE